MSFISIPEEMNEDANMSIPVATPISIWETNGYIDNGVLNAENLKLKRANKKLTTQITNLNLELQNILRSQRNHNKIDQLETMVRQYKKASSDLTNEYKKLKGEHETLKQNMDINTKQNETIILKQKNIIETTFKIININQNSGCKLPIPNPKDNRKILVTNVSHQIPIDPWLAGSGGQLICPGGKTIASTFNGEHLKVGDIVLLDITDCYNTGIIHKFSETEKYVLVNLPTAGYLFSDTGAVNSEIAIRELYKGLIL
jgi:hypothetical protein